MKIDLGTLRARLASLGKEKVFALAFPPEDVARNSGLKFQEQILKDRLAGKKFSKIEAFTGLSHSNTQRLFENAVSRVVFFAELLEKDIELVFPAPRNALEQIYFHAGFGLPLSQEQSAREVKDILDIAFSGQNSEAQKRARKLYEDFIVWNLPWTEACQAYNREISATIALAEAKKLVRKALRSLEPLSEQRLNGDTQGQTLFEKLSPEARQIVIEKAFFPSGNRKDYPLEQRREAGLLIALYVKQQLIEEAARSSGYRNIQTAQEARAEGLLLVSKALKLRSNTPTCS